ncbi:MAG TPA: acyltransferase family protein [Barnesiella viscericola]|uniref:Acyltransferase family protein n=1 Tax=Barnesiella viscericola TaxID=397865 RepID=A0A921MR82_9BACT|nr:acyltransferase family protein [Barnesiella viscericola]
MAFTRFIYHFHMPLFFLIAGFFYERSTRKESYGAFVWNKFQRLMFPYFILSWAIIGVKIGLDNYLQVDHPVTLDALYRVFYLPEAGYFLWFVYVLFLIFCIVPFFKPGKRLIILSLIALGIAFWNTAPTYCCFNLVCRNLIFFVVGMWTARKVWLERLMNRHLFLWTVLTISLSIVYTYLPHGFFTLSLTVIMGVTGSYMVVSLSQRIARCNHKMALIFNRLGACR